jgi:hypothetical protein
MLEKQIPGKSRVEFLHYFQLSASFSRIKRHFQGLLAPSYRKYLIYRTSIHLSHKISNPQSWAPYNRCFLSQDESVVKEGFLPKVTV